MRHRKHIIKLGRMSSHRKSMLSNMASSLILHKRIYTTFPKAKAVVPLVDRLITWAREGSLHSRRLSYRVLKDRSLVKRLFAEIAPAVSKHPGGYTRIIKAGNRIGDGAPMALVELVSEGEVLKEAPKKEKEKKKKKEKEKKK